MTLSINVGHGMRSLSSKGRVFETKKIDLLIKNRFVNLPGELSGFRGSIVMDGSHHRLASAPERYQGPNVSYI